MVKVLSYTLISLFLISCSAKKKKCETIVLDKTSVHHVDIHGDMGMYGYKIKEGPLKDYILEINGMNDGKEIDAHLIHPSKPLTYEPYMREAWKMTEKKDLANKTVVMNTDLSLKCGAKIYCFKLSYDGPMHQMPAMETH